MSSSEDLLLRLVDQTARIETKVDALAGHEQRIHRLERWQAAVAGAVGTVSLAIGATVSYLLNRS